ncbi:MAG TPA: L-histidine N(alpha)-methyltransferase [Polyangiaceae bacterium]|nr:L-histidine N(alpha)-methyltransferase [Polyangiaceae bacterium]
MTRGQSNRAVSSRWGHGLDRAADDAPPARALAEVWRSLAGEPRRLPCKLFYDAAGSRLFERITRLPEYYPTRTEVAILERSGREIGEAIGPRATIIEFGSGASMKTRLLLDALREPRVYVPIDISTEMLLSSARALAARYPNLDVRPVSGDYMHELELPLSADARDGAEASGKRVAFFPGSTIGNFEQDEAVSFLRRLRRGCGPTAELLIGVDLPKERAVLEAAYDDAAGVTARFNRNALRVLNRDYGASFRLEDFAHRSLWNEAAQRVEMHLVSQRDHAVRVGSRSFSLRAGEPIVTEHCYKYEPAAFQLLAESAGFRVAQVWLDERRLFSVQRLVPA